ncbi:hypothetical protein PC9H_008873 [Pleurotus ostreatus]|uniref:Uncharacterized protein n=1 Tax=Pleurotus ostreatus TaxID=5322 RepID=A0A8H6ZSG9_PLEOS|nr:uncharacterized protein PC9H_008873 [Pleurotus ostreatus]KAF7426504.1 hypothetical protein PC9H_008873 [Pleurotus ostreatus]
MILFPSLRFFQTTPSRPLNQCLNTLSTDDASGGLFPPRPSFTAALRQVPFPVASLRTVLGSSPAFLVLRLSRPLGTSRYPQSVSFTPLLIQDFCTPHSAKALPPANSYGAAPFPYQTDPSNSAHYPSGPPAAPVRRYEETTAYHSQPDANYAWEEFIILRRSVLKLQDKVAQLEELVTELKQFQFNMPSRLHPSTSSLGPSDSISRLGTTSGIDVDDEGEDLRAAYSVYLSQGDLVEKPPSLPDTVLWTFKSAQEAGSAAGLSATNSYRPSFNKALRDSKGQTLDADLVKLIKRTAAALASRILARHPIDKVAVDIRHIREYYRSRCPWLWYGSIVLLEQRHKEVGLCSAHWKADHLLGQSVLGLRQKAANAMKKQSTGELASILGSDDEQTLDVVFILPKKAKRPANPLSPLKSGPSKRGRTEASKQRPPKLMFKQPARPLHMGTVTTAPAMQGSPPASPSRAASPASTENQSSMGMLGTNTATLPPSSLVDSPLSSHVSSAKGSLSMISTDDGFENLRRTLQSPQFKFPADVIDPAMELLAGMEQSPTHGGHGFLSSNTIALLKRVQTADPACIENEDDLLASWGHWQWSGGDLTISGAITSWQDVGSTETARELIAAALTTCKAARYLCLSVSPRPQSYLSDSYLDRIISTLYDVWKRSGGVILLFIQFYPAELTSFWPFHKGKARAAIVDPAQPMAVEPAQPTATGTGNDGSGDGMGPLAEDDDTQLADGASKQLQADVDSLLQSKLMALTVNELKTLVAKKQIPNISKLNKATCVSSLVALQQSARPTITDLDEILAKRGPKKSKSKSAKSAANQPAAAPPSSSADVSQDLTQVPRIIASTASLGS